MSVTLGDRHASYSTVKNCVSRFKTGRLSTEDEECFGSPTKVTITENVDDILSTILGNQIILYPLKRMHKP
jgi:hypothetical protein